MIKLSTAQVLLLNSYINICSQEVYSHQEMASSALNIIKKNKVIDGFRFEAASGSSV